MKNTEILPIGTTLFRYNLTQPGDEWDKNYTSTEYHYHKMGVKNKIGALFFYDNMEYCCDVCYCALQKQSQKYAYLTSCKTNKELHFLDLRQDRVIDIIRILCENKLENVLSLMQFYKNDNDIIECNYILNDVKTFGELCNKNQPSFKDNCDILNIQKNIDNFFHPTQQADPIRCRSYLGQTLTDFCNGFVFKTALSKQGYNGYVFNEGNTTHKLYSATWCIFESCNVSKPNNHKKEFNINHKKNVESVF